MKNKYCYCDLWDKDPQVLIRQGVVEGFCGICEICGMPGHTKSHPAPVAYTGSWCDKCYQKLRWTWLFRLPLGWIVVFIFALLFSILISK